MTTTAKNETQQHTPGPAFVERCTDGTAQVTLIDGNMQRSIPVEMFHAAPDMLDALRLIDPLGDLSLARDIKAALATQAERDAFDRAIAAVRAAIAKATGGAP